MNAPGSAKPAVDGLVDLVEFHLRSGARRHDATLRRSLARAAPHAYDELIDSLFVFLACLVRARDADVALELGVKPDHVLPLPPEGAAIAPALRKPKRAISEETRAKMRAAQRRRQEQARARRGLA